MTWTLVIEVYREYGLKYDEAVEELNKRLAPQVPGVPAKKKPPKQADDAASMAVLQALMGESDFRGPRG